MSKVSEVINKLQKLEDENGDVECNIYISSELKTIGIRLEDIVFDDTKKDIYIGVY